jgi:hypothetical protein
MLEKTCPLMLLHSQLATFILVTMKAPPTGEQPNTACIKGRCTFWADRKQLCGLKQAE